MWQHPLSLAQYMFTFISTVFFFFSTVLTFVILCFSSSVLCFSSSPSSVHCFSPQYGVKHRQYMFSLSVLCSSPSILCFSSSVLCLPSSVLCFFVNTVLDFSTIYGGTEPSRNSICKRLWSPGFDSEESISPGWESIPGLLKRSTNMGSGNINWWNWFFGIYSWAP